MSLEGRKKSENELSETTIREGRRDNGDDHHGIG